MPENNEVSTGKLILVTGANRGLGLEIINLVSKRHAGATVLLGSRSLSNGEEAIKQLQKRGNPCNNVKPVQLDVTDEKTIKNVMSSIQQNYGGKIDILYNNSGILSSAPGKDGAQQTLDVNYYGVQKMNKAALPLMSKGGRIVIVSSIIGAMSQQDSPDALRKVVYHPENLSMADVDNLATEYLNSQDKESVNSTKLLAKFPPPEKTYGSYGVSKLLVNAYGRVLARELQSKEITVVLVCPGYCATDINQHSGYKSAEDGAKDIIHAENVKHTDTGSFYSECKQTPFAVPMPDLESAKKIYEAKTQAV